MAYQALPAHVDLAANDREVIDFWRERKIFQASLEQTAPSAAKADTNKADANAAGGGFYNPAARSVETKR